MYYNNGDIKISGTKEQAKKVLAFLRAKDDRFILRKLWEKSEGEYDIDLNMLDGNILEATLQSLVTFAEKENINVTFDVRYAGSEAGGYIYTGSSGMQHLSESGCVLHDVSDEELMEECHRRGIIDYIV